MNIQLTWFDPDPAIQDWLNISKYERRSGSMDSDPTLKRIRLQAVDLPVVGGKCMQR